jgi:chitodextrinase
VADFAQYQKLAFIAPFWTQYFANYLNYSEYGTLPGNTVLTDAFDAAAAATSAGTFTSTGQAWENIVIPTPDTQPPHTPATPTTNSVGTAGVTLQWTADYDNVGVASYHVYRNGVLVGSTSVNYYWDSGLDMGTTYTYTVSASDASGNVSEMSEPLTVTTYN